MNSTKKFFWTIAIGALIGAISFAWFSPYVIVWYFSPPAGMGVSCEEPVAWAIRTYRKVMFTGVLLGAIVSAILFFAFRSRKPAPQGLPPGSSPPAA